VPVAQDPGSSDPTSDAERAEQEQSLPDAAGLVAD